MNPLERLKAQNDKAADQFKQDQRTQQIVDATLQSQETVVRSFGMLVDYLDKRVGRTEVVNQLTEIGTPDAMKVVEAISSLHETLKTHENTDLTEITSVMRQVLDEAKKIPKTEINIPKVEIPDNVAQFKSLEKAVKSLEKVVKAQKLVAEAPIVNLPETQVNLEAPDLSPLQDNMRDVVKAVEGIVIPEYKTDNKAVEDLIKKSNKLLEKLLDKPVGGGGGGGGGRATPYQDSNDVPYFVEVDTQGNIPTTSLKAPMAEKITVDGTTTYIAIAPPGTSQATAAWRAKKIAVSGSDTVITWADGNANFDNVATNLTSLSYS